MDKLSIEDKKHSRRDFLKYILGIGFIGWIIAVIYPIALYLKPPKAPEIDVQNLKIGKVDEKIGRAHVWTPVTFFISYAVFCLK